MSKEQDALFFKTFAGVVGGLIIATLIFFFVARAIGEANYTASRASKEAQPELIKPVGEVQVTGSRAPRGEEAKEVPTKAAQEVQLAGGADINEQSEISEDLLGSPSPEAEAFARKGKEIYDSTCVACHGAGIAGAPKLDDVADWKPRINQGMDTLYQHAIKGFQGASGLMPPKGGRTDLSDEQIQAAVNYMVSQVGPVE